MPLIAQTPKPRIILGMMTFGPDPEHGARITTQEETKEVLDLLQARGYSEIDTARVYADQQQEAWTREAGWKERGLTLATKVLYPSTPGLYKREKVFESVEASLKDLGTDCVEILYLHAADRSVPFAETLEAVNELHKAGKFVRLGLSNYTSFEVAEIIMMCKYNGWVRPTIYQGMYNAITRSLETELIPACRRYGLDLVVYNPIAGGLFSGKIKSKDLVPEDGRFSNASTNMGGQYRKRYFRESTFQALKIVEEASEKSGISMIEIALRWTVHHSKLKVLDGNDGVIVGVSSAKQLGENLDALEKGPLPDDVVEALEKAWIVSKGDTTNYWHLDLEYTYNPQEVLFGPSAK